MTKIAIIADTHFGARGDKQALLDHMEVFYDQVFFPTLKEKNVAEVWHLGDLVDKRKGISFHTLATMKRVFLDPLALDADVYHTSFILGNHDMYYKNRVGPNALDELLSGYPFSVHTEPSIVDGITVIPWICEETEKKARQLISGASTRFCLGHLELRDWEMDRGRFSHTGDDKEDYRGFDAVLSGHFHHKSSYNNIHFMGAPYQMTWTDYKDAKGFHIFDIDTGELEYIENPYALFHKFIYDDTERNVTQLLEEIEEKLQISDTFVKVIVRHKTNEFAFDSFIDRINSVGVADLQIVEDHRNIDLLSDDTIVEQAEDTLTILNNYIEGMECHVEVAKLEYLLKSLYDEAEVLRV